MQYRFASREWMAAVHGIIAQRASCLKAQGLSDRVSLCEIYTDVPADLGWGRSEVAWSVVYENGDVDFRLEERDDVRFKAVGRHDAFTRLACFALGSDPARAAEYAALGAAEIAAGNIRLLIGRGFKEPGQLEYFHDVIARITRAV